MTPSSKKMVVKSNGLGSKLLQTNEDKFAVNMAFQQRNASDSHTNTNHNINIERKLEIK